jgi:hypothetical protein
MAVLENLRPGPGTMFRPMISARGHVSVSGRQVVAEPGIVRDVGDQTLVAATESVAGVAVDRNGKPVAYVRVYAVPQSSGPEEILQSCSSMVTGSDGRFVLGDMPKGPVQVHWEVLSLGKRPVRMMRTPDPHIVVEAGERNILLTVEGQ